MSSVLSSKKITENEDIQVEFDNYRNETTQLLSREISERFKRTSPVIVDRNMQKMIKVHDTQQKKKAFVKPDKLKPNKLLLPTVQFETDLFLLSPRVKQMELLSSPIKKAMLMPLKPLQISKNKLKLELNEVKLRQSPSLLNHTLNKFNYSDQSSPIQQPSVKFTSPVFQPCSFQSSPIPTQTPRQQHD